MKLDILAFGAHPDDVELGCAATLLVEKNNGKSIGIIDLTEGEFGSRGSVELRYEEAKKAGELLGVSTRENLQIQDGFIENTKENKLKIIAAIRKYQPEIALITAPTDRHPDHGNSCKLLQEACFLSGLAKIETTDDNGKPQQHWRPKRVFSYIQDYFLEPDFIVDVSAHYAQKEEAIKAYGSQFYNPDSNEPITYISTPDFLEQLQAKAMVLGKRIGVKYGEGFIVQNSNIGLKSLFDQVIPSIV